MPESNGFGLIAAVVSAVSGGLGVIVGAALSLIGKGRRDQRIESGLARSHERHDEHDKKFSSLEQAIRNMTAAFTRADGEPRFVSAVVCEKEQKACHEALIEKFSAGSARFGNIEREIQELKAAQADNLQIIISEIRKAR